MFLYCIIRTTEDVLAALNAGTSAITTTKKEIWDYFERNQEMT
jgi:glycerol-3-phosphate responsive antiterminator